MSMRFKRKPTAPILSGPERERQGLAVRAAQAALGDFDAVLLFLNNPHPRLRGRPWTPLVKALRPELGLLQITPRPVIEEVVRRFVPGGRDGWSAVGVDEFLRAIQRHRPGDTVTLRVLRDGQPADVKVTVQAAELLPQGRAE